MDIFDRAQELEERHRATALALHANRPHQPSLTHCEDCGEPIPDIRQRIVPGCTRCVSCQEQAER